jgi:hypothetical protein
LVTDEYLRSYGDTNIKADVVGLIEILTAKETWFLNNLGKTTAIATVHINQTDTLKTANSQAVEEAADLTILATTTPSQLINVVEQIAVPFAVSFTQQLVQHYSGTNELARQSQKALADWGNAAEFDLLRSTLVSGASGTVPKMNGVITAISKSTNTTVHSSGTALAASIINGLVKENYDQSNGNLATDLFVGSFLRNVIDGFTQKSNSLVQIPSSTIDNMIDVFQTSFARVNVHVHRYVQSSTTAAGLLGADVTGRLLAVRPETLKIAYLQRAYMQDLATVGPATKKAVVGNLTLEVRNQDSNWVATGFDID